MNAGRPPAGGVFVAVDVHYLPAGGARAAAVVAADVTFGDLLADRTAHVPEVRPYRPGQFYLRELPPLHVVLDGLQQMRLLVVDGYADLDPAGRPGLGAHAHAEFGVPVTRPLYVTAAGMPRHDAADMVRHMTGRHRLPDALRRADALARGRPLALD
jgi:deoxyribonuclease V